METEKTNNKPKPEGGDKKPVKLVTIMSGVHNVQVVVEADRVTDIIKAIDDVRNGTSKDCAIGDFLDITALVADRKADDNGAWVDVTDVSLVLVSNPPKSGGNIAVPSGRLSVPNVVPPRGLNLRRGG